MINEVYQVETAEGIDIDIFPAGIGVRTFAFFFDFFIRASILFCASMVLGFLGSFGYGLFFILLFVVEWFYPVIFEVYKGATPGKSAFGLIVVNDQGLPVSFGASLTRNLFRFVDFLPLFYFIGATSLMMNKKRKRVGDIVAGTTVIYKHKQAKPIFFNFEKQVVEMPAMTTEQQQQVIAFAHRGKYLSEARRNELANIIAPVLGASNEEAVEKLKSIAAVIVGRA